MQRPSPRAEDVGSPRGNPPRLQLHSLFGAGMPGHSEASSFQADEGPMAGLHGLSFGHAIDFVQGCSLIGASSDLACWAGLLTQTQWLLLRASMDGYGRLPCPDCWIAGIQQ
eukprot:symbB.v1.2.021525.t1/scaffold1865.1/size98072/2